MPTTPFEAAVAEATVEPIYYEYKGQKYELAEQKPLLPYMRLVSLGEDGEDSLSVAAIGAMFDFLKASFKDDATFARFFRAASREDGDRIFEICDEVIDLVSSRPQQSSAASASGQSKSGKPSSKQPAKRASRKSVTAELPDEDED